MGNNFSKKSLAVPKKMKGESLVSPGMVCYAEKQEKPFWFSSLDQIVHFDAIIFCRTFVELFWSVRVDRKKRVTIIVAFHFMKRRLKKSEKSHSAEKNLWKEDPSTCFKGLNTDFYPGRHRILLGKRASPSGFKLGEKQN